MDHRDIIAVPLAPSIDISNFSCGGESWAKELNDFLKNAALKEQDQGLNKTYLFNHEREGCLGFAAVLASHLQIDKDQKLGLFGRERVPYPAIPALLIGRLGVDERHQRRGVGRYILAWARVTARNIPIGCRFLTLQVEVENEAAINFYESEGFIRPPHFKSKNDMHWMIYDLYSS